jgi:hypothetical protein
MRIFYIILYILIILISIPWYWSDNVNIVLYGFPFWVIIAILGSFSASCLTTYLLLKTSKDNE